MINHFIERYGKKFKLYEPVESIDEFGRKNLTYKYIKEIKVLLREPTTVNSLQIQTSDGNLIIKRERVVYCLPDEEVKEGYLIENDGKKYEVVRVENFTKYLKLLLNAKEGETDGTT